MIGEELRDELIARGFTDDLESPNGTMALTVPCSTSELAELLDSMVTRREKVFRSVDVVGAEAAHRSYDDVLLAIDAIKAVIARLSLE